MVRFCQIIGVFPYSMEIIVDEGRAERAEFSFSWRKVPSQWFVMVLFLSVVLPLIWYYFSMEVIFTWKLSTVVLVVSFVMNISAYTFTITNRWLILQPKKWNRIVSFVYRIEMFLVDENVMMDVKGIRKQTHISIFVAVAMVNICSNK